MTFPCQNLTKPGYRSQLVTFWHDKSQHLACQKPTSGAPNVNFWHPRNQHFACQKPTSGMRNVDMTRVETRFTPGLLMLECQIVACQKRTVDFRNTTDPGKNLGKPRVITRVKPGFDPGPNRITASKPDWTRVETRVKPGFDPGQKLVFARNVRI